MKQAVFFIILITLFIDCKAKESGKYNISGTIGNIPDSTVVTLLKTYAEISISVASDTIINGNFNFSGKLDPDISEMSLRMKDQTKYSGLCQFFIGESEIKITGNNGYLSTWKIESDLPDQIVENKIKELTSRIIYEFDSLYLIQNINYSKRIYDDIKTRNKIDSLRSVKNQIELDFFTENFNSTNAVSHLYNILTTENPIEVNLVKKIYPKIEQDFLKSREGQGIKNFFNKLLPLEIGDKFRDFEAYDIYGEAHKLSDYLDKYILLDFWSVGCYPCIQSIPELKKMYDKYKEKLNIVGINTNTKKEFWISVSESDSIPWVNLSDGKGHYGGSYHLYGIKGVPNYFLINKDGVIIEKLFGYGVGSIEQLLSKYLE
ncbi:MAG: AhpC/TSA family protein [Candidatus Delongbacteria bacterium]|nr:AhpC/TSA family protein [Candidatus Delongbacteria bacterium]MBN2834069.1 AhpC/TSA family protein [Candidatus Delongbacteria bacterium]